MSANIEERPKLSVITIVYNDEKNIAECIRSILSQTYGNFQYIIIDDCSTDETPNIIKSFEDPRIVYSRNDRNRKQGYSRNRGIQVAQTDVIAWIDSDCVAQKEWLENLLKGMNHYDVVMGRSESFGGSKWAQRTAHGYRTYISNNNVDGTMQILDTRNCAMRKHVLEEVGLFDEQSAPTEDRELGIRILKNGYKIGFVSDAIIHHHDPLNLIPYFWICKKHAISQYYVAKKHNLKMPAHVRQSRAFGASILLLICSLSLWPLVAIAKYILVGLIILTPYSFKNYGSKILKSKSLSFYDAIYYIVWDLGFKYGDILTMLKRDR